MHPGTSESIYKNKKGNIVTDINQNLFCDSMYWWTLPHLISLWNCWTYIGTKSYIT